VRVMQQHCPQLTMWDTQSAIDVKMLQFLFLNSTSDLKLKTQKSFAENNSEQIFIFCFLNKTGCIGGVSLLGLGARLRRLGLERRLCRGPRAESGGGVLEQPAPSPPARGSEAEPQSKLTLVHFSLKI